jgi:hypothetical protein
LCGYGKRKEMVEMGNFHLKLKEIIFPVPRGKMID